jgi:hypothetical protein
MLTAMWLPPCARWIPQHCRAAKPRRGAGEGPQKPLKIQVFEGASYAAAKHRAPGVASDLANHCSRSRISAPSQIQRWEASVKISAPNQIQRWEASVSDPAIGLVLWWGVLVWWFSWFSGFGRGSYWFSGLVPNPDSKISLYKYFMRLVLALNH